MSVDRNIISISLNNAQADAVRNSPEGQSAFIQNLIDDYLSKDSIERSGIPYMSVELEKYLAKQLSRAEKPSVEVIDSDIPEFMVMYHPCPMMSLDVKLGFKNELRTMLNCQFVPNGMTAGGNIWKAHIRLTTQLTPNGKWSQIATRSDTYSFFIHRGSRMEHELASAQERLYPEYSDIFAIHETGRDPVGKNCHDVLSPGNFGITFFSPNANSVWNMPDLPLYVSRVEFDGGHLYIDFRNTADFQMYRQWNSSGDRGASPSGFVTVDVTSLSIDGSPVETTRYNVRVPECPPWRSPLSSFPHLPAGHSVTEVDMSVMDQGDPDVVPEVTEELMDLYVTHVAYAKDRERAARELYGQYSTPQSSKVVRRKLTCPSMQELMEKNIIRKNDIDKLASLTTTQRIAVIEILRTVTGEMIGYETIRPGNCEYVVSGKDGNPCIRYTVGKTLESESQITRDIPLENVAVFLPYFGADGQDRKIRIPDEFPHKITACYDSAGTFYRYSF